jgi:hypothetical protein
MNYRCVIARPLACTLKGKNAARLMWAVANPDNADEPVSWIRNFIKNEK